MKPQSKLSGTFSIVCLAMVTGAKRDHVLRYVRTAFVQRNDVMGLKIE